MRNYYICDAIIPSKIYTEREKILSDIPGHRFGLIGKFTTRRKAFDALKAFYVGNGYRIKTDTGNYLFVDEVTMG